MVQDNAHILLIGDTRHEVRGVLGQAAPGVQVTVVDDFFDGIAELSSNHYSAVLASGEPIERRPQAAIATLRQAVGDGRIVLFGHPTLEPLARKMLSYGCDDYVLTPPTPAELRQIFSKPILRLAHDDTDDARSEPAAVPTPPATGAVATSGDAPSHAVALDGLPLAELILDAMVQHPASAPAAVVARINELIQPDARLVMFNPPAEAPAQQTHPSTSTVSQPVRVNQQDVALLRLEIATPPDLAPIRHWLSQVAGVVGQLITLQDRHNRLQKLAVTDEMTGLYNGRYFRHFLTRILERARTMRFPVTLLLFDIDNFKQYNDRFGHGVGDGILQQTASLIKRCVRDHDLVARIGGDEFAVVFWEKDGPRQPQTPNAGVSGRPPQTPLQIFRRFQRLLATEAFPALGAHGVGTLTISGGLAVYPYDASSVQSLIESADKALMLGAKRSGKNSITLVGDDAGTTPGEAPATPEAPIE